MSSIRIMAAAIGIAVLGTAAFAQMGPTTNQDTSPVTVHPDRTTASKADRAKMAEHRKQLAQKRNACRQQAREQKIPLRKRYTFLKECTAK